MEEYLSLLENINENIVKIIKLNKIYENPIVTEKILLYYQQLNEINDKLLNIKVTLNSNNTIHLDADELQQIQLYNDQKNLLKRFLPFMISYSMF